MPMPSIFRECIDLTEAECGCRIPQCGASTAHIDGLTSSYCRSTVGIDGERLITTVQPIGRMSAGGTIPEAGFVLEYVRCGHSPSGRLSSAAALAALNPDDTDLDAAMEPFPRPSSAEASPTRSGQTGRDDNRGRNRSIRLGPSTPIGCKTTMAPWRARIAAHLIEERLALPLHLGILAAAVRLSTSQFLKTFKTSFGVTPHQWLIRCRLARSLGFLAGTELPLAEIALECGFADQSHFTRTFSRVIGIPPGAWRRASRSRPQNADPVIPLWNGPYPIGGLLQSSA